jgi:hypothetical protein
MSGFFDRKLAPPNPKEPLVDEGGALTMGGNARWHDLWAWVSSGFITIPCDASGTADAITLTPRMTKDIGGSGFVHLLPFTFVAEETSTAAVTIEVLGPREIRLDAVPAYVGAVAAGAGDVVAGVPYIGLYCEATDSLPDRMVLK